MTFRRYPSESFSAGLAAVLPQIAGQLRAVRNRGSVGIEGPLHIMVDIRDDTKIVRATRR
jgi:hypothetical protein